MKRPLCTAALLLLCGCATYHVNLEDNTLNEDGTKRTIVTEIKGTAFASSIQNISKIKATQTDKTQSFGTDSVGQQTTMTNEVQMLRELNKMLGR